MLEFGSNRNLIVEGRFTKADVTITFPMDQVIDHWPDGTTVFIVCMCENGNPNDDDCTFDVESPTSNHIVCKGTCNCIMMIGEISPEGVGKPPQKYG